MLTSHTPVRAAEGITVRRTGDDLIAHATRVDRTHIRIQRTGFAETVARHAQDGSFLLLDGNVAELWRDELQSVLPADRHLIVEPGEHHKNLDHAQSIIDRLRDRGAHRRMPLVAIGGGATCDLVGQVASLYFRGVPAVYVPTTLLAMIDAAIGGKVGVNHPEQKNLIGGFSHPTAVDIHLDALNTLPAAEISAALGEALKIAIVDDPDDLFAVLEQGVAPDDADILLKVVRTCVEAKLRLLGDNAFERDLRRELNFGHTVAHPLEDLTGFRIRHGTAVGIGIAVAAHIALHRGQLDPTVFSRILTTIRRLGLPVMDSHIDTTALIDRVHALQAQRGGASLHYVLPLAIGKVDFTDTVTRDELARAIRDLRAHQEIYP
ncbi:3-dehydroquinate synthase family protein [Streptomyces sp. N35]|uniref:3-dehydroquinate synthase n=1 Tax=Streptomyces sp. N35 TaxID=2795730 RepID=UPI0018F5A3C2|nr:3-dehydroquinate synthase family protein [Streptomyces sp. N35]